MQIIFHMGVHFTDDERILKCLLRNNDRLSKDGVVVPGPGRYRKLLEGAIGALHGAVPTADAREVLIDEILDGERADTMILSNSNFLAAQQACIGDTVFYPDAVRVMAAIQAVFQTEHLEVFMAIRNPATFLPTLRAKVSDRQFDAMTYDVDPSELRWSELISRLRVAAPEIPITIWCNEDTPLIWGQIIRDIAGINPDETITGEFDLVNAIMSDGGAKRFNAYLAKHPKLSESQQRRVMAAFLDKFALTDQVEEELDLPGWNADLVQDLTEIYDEDVARILTIPGVNVIAP